MSASGLHQWFPSGRWWQVGFGVYQVLFVAWRLRTTDGLVGQLTGVALAAASAFIISSALSYRVRADDDGLHVRGAWWRTRSAPWAAVAGIGTGRGWHFRELVVTTEDGRRIPTGLGAADHASLVSHWRVTSGRATLEDYAAYADHLDDAHAGYVGSR